MTINAKTLFDPSLEKDNCGFGLIAQRNGKRSRKLVKKSILGLTSMTHRGAIGADGKTGDGCGLLFDLNHSFFKLKVDRELDVELPDFFAVAQLFHNNAIDFYISSIRKFLNSQDLDIAVTRSVPVNNEILGRIARQNLPNISQVFITSKNTNLNKERFEACLLQARKFIEEKFDNDEEFYVCSMSTQTIVYKGLMLPSAIDEFYLDLKDKKFEAKICLFHQRFSTNTLPRWHLAQPFRLLAHNGEINAIRGNRNWAKARKSKFSTALIPEITTFKNLVNEKGSDSSALDNMIEI